MWDDMWAKGRQAGDKRNVARGERSGRSKLTSAQVAAIREAHIPYKFSARKLSEIYGVRIQTIQKILWRTSWVDL
jgi:hypothetical protein